MSEKQLAVVEAGIAPMEGGARVAPCLIRIEDYLRGLFYSHLAVHSDRLRIGLKRLRVRDLLRLEKGQVLESAWSQTSDVPVAAGEVRLCWGEFEVSGQQIGVRLTQLL